MTTFSNPSIRLGSQAAEPARLGEQMQTRVRAAMFDALACSEQSYAAAGITFLQDGPVTHAIHRGHAVASMSGRFSKGHLLQALLRNIAASSRKVAAELLPQLALELNLPNGHMLAFDVDANVHEVEHRGVRHLSAYVFMPPGEDNTGRPMYWGEILFDLYRCQVHLTLKVGEQFGRGPAVPGWEAKIFEAETYGELRTILAHQFNEAVTALEGQHSDGSGDALLSA